MILITGHCGAHGPLVTRTRVSMIYGTLQINAHVMEISLVVNRSVDQVLRCYWIALFHTCFSCNIRSNVCIVC
jgi:hypothetical protein